MFTKWTGNCFKGFSVRRLVVLLVLILFVKSANGRDKPFVLGVVHEIKSRELSETRTFNIYLPDGYDTSKTRYPVIYLLDGSKDEDFTHIVGVVQFLTMIGSMPQTIVVGIANVDRRRDFTFPTTIDSDKKAYPTTGGSERFISFMEKELLPYVAHKYRTTASKIIIGQSLGGLLARELLLKRPGLFNGYVIVSPSLWWDGESLLAKASGLLSAAKTDATVYISVGEEEEQRMKDDAKVLVNTLKEHASRYHVYFVPLAGEDHLTILHNAVYKSIEMLLNILNAK